MTNKEFLEQHKRIPSGYCVVCYYPDDECNCKEESINKKLKELRIELEKKL